MKKHLGVVVMLFSMIACNEKVEEIDIYKNALVNISVEVGELSKVGNEAGILTEGMLGLFFFTDGIEDLSYNASNRKVVYENGRWVITGEPLRWKDKLTNVKYSAYYPWVANAINMDETINTSLDITIPQIQTHENIKSSDFLYATYKSTTAGSNNGNIDILFDHKLAKLNVELKIGSELNNDCVINSVVIRNCTIKGNFDMSTGLWNSITDNEVHEITMCGSNQSYECILIPQSVTFEMVIYALIDGQYKSFTTTSLIEQVFSSGTEYFLNLNIGRDTIQAGIITSKAWHKVQGEDLETI